MYARDGVPSSDELVKFLPPEDRLERGPCVVVECIQEIPCNPCVKACPRGEIKIEGNINNIPIVDYDKCNGCGVCIPRCPGLAIFVVHKNYSEKSALISLPYEFLPIPKVGDEVIALDREGKPITKAKVIRVLNPPKYDHTAVVTIEIPKDLIHTIRHIQV